MPDDTKARIAELEKLMGEAYEAKNLAELGKLSIEHAKLTKSIASAEWEARSKEREEVTAKMGEAIKVAIAPFIPKLRELGAGLELVKLTWDLGATFSLACFKAKAASSTGTGEARTGNFGNRTAPDKKTPEMVKLYGEAELTVDVLPKRFRDEAPITVAAFYANHTSDKNAVYELRKILLRVDSGDLKLGAESEAEADAADDEAAEATS